VWLAMFMSGSYPSCIY